MFAEIIYFSTYKKPVILTKNIQIVLFVNFAFSNKQNKQIKIYQNICIASYTKIPLHYYNT